MNENADKSRRDLEKRVEALEEANAILWSWVETLAEQDAKVLILALSGLAKVNGLPQANATRDVPGEDWIAEIFENRDLIVNRPKEE